MAIQHLVVVLTVFMLLKDRSNKAVWSIRPVRTQGMWTVSTFRRTEEDQTNRAIVTVHTFVRAFITDVGCII